MRDKQAKKWLETALLGEIVSTLYLTTTKEGEKRIICMGDTIIYLMSYDSAATSDNRIIKLESKLNLGVKIISSQRSASTLWNGSDILFLTQGGNQKIEELKQKQKLMNRKKVFDERR